MNRLLIVVMTGMLISAAAAENPRVYIEESQSWEIKGNIGGNDDAFGGTTSGGARPQTAEIIKTFGERCPAITINNRKEKADYIVVLDHERRQGPHPSRQQSRCLRS